MRREIRRQRICVGRRTWAVESIVVGVLMRRQAALSNNSRQIHSVDDEQNRTENRPLRYTAVDIIDTRALTTATNMLLLAI